MTEFNGNPESGVDQLLNRSAGIELPSDTKPIETEETQRLRMITQLQSQVHRLEQELVSTQNVRDGYIDLYGNARDFIQASINRDDWTPEELREPFWTELAELMDLSIEREVDVTVTVTFTGTMTLPVGVDPEDLGAYEWAGELEHNYYGSDFTVDDVEAKEN